MLLNIGLANSEILKPACLRFSKYCRFSFLGPFRNSIAPAKTEPESQKS
jgi:hypothetical protein